MQVTEDLFNIQYVKQHTTQQAEVELQTPKVHLNHP